MLYMMESSSVTLTAVKHLQDLGRGGVGILASFRCVQHHPGAVFEYNCKGIPILAPQFAGPGGGGALCAVFDVVVDVETSCDSDLLVAVAISAVPSEDKRSVVVVLKGDDSISLIGNYQKILT